MIGQDVAKWLESVAGPTGYRFLEPYGENRGPIVDKWEAIYGMRGEPYCGIAEAYAVRQIRGGWQAYRGNEFLSPSVARIEENGRRLGWQWDGGRIPSGAVATYGGNVHTNFVLMDHGPIGGQFTAVGGNESDGARVSERSTFQCRIWVPPAITEPPVPVPAFDYGLQDVRAHGKQFRLSSFLTRRSRDKRLARYLEPGSAYRKYHPRPHRTGKGRGLKYIIIGGPVEWYGPYDTKEMRADARRLLVPRLRRFWKFGSANVTVLRDFRVPEKDYLEALEARREWLATQN